MCVGCYGKGHGKQQLEELDLIWRLLFTCTINSAEKELKMAVRINITAE